MGACCGICSSAVSTGSCKGVAQTKGAGKPLRETNSIRCSSLPHPVRASLFHPLSSKQSPHFQPCVLPLGSSQGSQCRVFWPSWSWLPCATITLRPTGCPAQPSPSDQRAALRNHHPQTNGLPCATITLRPTGCPAQPSPSGQRAALRNHHPQTNGLPCATIILRPTGCLISADVNFPQGGVECRKRCLTQEAKVC